MMKTGCLFLPLGAALLSAILPAGADDSLRIKGDILTRVETIENRFNDQDDVRNFHGRARLFLQYQSSPIEAGVRGVIEGKTIPNLDSRFQKGYDFDADIFVDRSYVTFKSGICEISAGQTDNPFTYTIPVADKNMPVLGVVGSANITPWLKTQALYDYGRVLTEDTGTSLVGGQIIGEWDVEGLKLSGNVGYQHVLDFDEKYRCGNSIGEFDVITAGASALLQDTPLGPVKLLVEYARNAATDEENEAMMVGIKVGTAQKPGTFSFSAGYNAVEMNSLVGGLTNRDSPRTNYENITGLIQYRLSDNVTTYLFSGNPKHIVPLGVHDNERQRVIEFGVNVEF
jgi:hypothetical protein